MITAPGFPNQQFSIGDIVMGLGIINLCFEGSRVPRPTARRCRKPRRRLELGRSLEQPGAVEHDLERPEHRAS